MHNDRITVPRGGLFIAIEGPDGVGKSTAARLLCARLDAVVDQPVLRTREPGGTMLGEKVRSVLRSGLGNDPVSDLLLFSAARRELVTKVIKPALAQGCIVVSDRFTMSTYAYQGAGQGVPYETIASANRIATGGLSPGLTMVLDLDDAAWLQRLGGRETQRERFEDPAILDAARNAYRGLAARTPGAVIVSADGAPEETVERMFAHVADLCRGARSRGALAL